MNQRERGGGGGWAGGGGERERGEKEIGREGGRERVLGRKSRGGR